MKCTFWLATNEQNATREIVFIWGKQCDKDATWAVGNSMGRCEEHAELLLASLVAENAVREVEHPKWPTLESALNIRRIVEMA